MSTLLDIVDRLYAHVTACTITGNAGSAYCRAAEDAAEEIIRLRSAYLAHIQMENACKRTGAACRDPAKCGCFLECAALVMDAPLTTSLPHPSQSQSAPDAGEPGGEK